MIALLVLAALAFGAGTAGAVDRVPAVLHVHSDLTTGELSLDELATAATREGIEAIFLAENYLLRVEYGLPPFRALTRVVHDGRSILPLGVDRYLARVTAAAERHPNVVFVPGVEVMPHYRWSGAPWTFTMTAHDTQKNLLVFGVTDPAVLARLPAIGNRAAGYLGLQSLLDAAVVALVVPGIWALATKRARRVRVGRAYMLVRERRWRLGIVLLAIAVVAIVRGWPFLTDRFPYWTDAGLAPHQALIDAVASHGGVAVWSFPEARDAGERAVGPVQVRWRTEPYADDLLRTARYAAFGAVYEDTTRFEQPGQGWDRVLLEFVRGERSRPAWAVGESGYHGPRSGKQLATVQTVFLTRDRSPRGLLDALAAGRMYAVYRARETGLVLTDFRLASAFREAGSGETLALARGAPFEATVGIDASGSAQPVRAVLVKNGVIVERWSGRTPLGVAHRETFDGAPAFYRVDVFDASRRQRLLTNPIFVRPG